MNKYLLIFFLFFAFQNVWQLTLSMKTAVVITAEENQEEQSSADKLFKDCILTPTIYAAKWVITNRSAHINILHISQSVTPVTINVETPPPNIIFV